MVCEFFALSLVSDVDITDIQQNLIRNDVWQRGWSYWNDHPHKKKIKVDNNWEMWNTK